MTIALEARHLSKHYAGITAVDDLSLRLSKGEIHALIGPNGAGKSTVVGILSGEIAADSGVILLDGEEVTGSPVWQRAGRGLGRTYQVTSVIREMTVQENIVIAMLAQEYSTEIGFRRVSGNRKLGERAGDILERFGLADNPDLPAGKLSHGGQGRLEIAMCLCANPSVMLLDEPMSGMSLQDGEDIMMLLSGIREDTAILLVEHDMEAVFRLADRISVMASGRVIASGLPEEIRNHAEVVEAYLGEDHA